MPGAAQWLFLLYTQNACKGAVMHELAWTAWAWKHSAIASVRGMYNAASQKERFNDTGQHGQATTSGLLHAVLLHTHKNYDMRKKKYVKSANGSTQPVFTRSTYLHHSSFHGWQAHDCCTIWLCRSRKPYKDQYTQPQMQVSHARDNALYLFEDKGNAIFSS